MSLRSVVDHGAVGDGVTLDTAAIQAAIDASHADGGGTVLLPAGRTYLTGSIELRSFVELHVERGAVLQGSPRWEDYTARFTVGALSAGVVTDGTDTSAALVTAREATCIAITGAGIIDGAGAAFATGVNNAYGDILELPNERPFLAFLVGCTNVTVRDVTLRDSALWTLRLTGCEDVVIHALRIRADVRLPNSDGIDLDRCRRVRISDCDIECGDDAISLKTCDEWPQYGACEDITVTGCTLSCRSSALVVGVDVSAPIRNVVFSSCVIRRSHRGLSVTIGTGAEGHVDNVLFSDIVVETQLYSAGWWGGGEAIFVRAAAWHDEVGRIRNVRFRNILARSEGGIVLYAQSPGLVQGVVLEDIRLELGRSTDWPMRRDLRPTAEGGPHEGPIPAIHIARASDVTLRHCSVEWTSCGQDDYGPALQVVDAPGLVLDQLTASAPRPDMPAATVNGTAVLLSAGRA